MKSTKRPRILLVTDTPDPAGGGAEAQFFQLRDTLQLTGKYEIYTLGCWPFPPEKPHPATPQADHQFLLADAPSRLWRLWWNMFAHPGITRKIRAVLQQVQPDLIHLHNIRRHTPALLKAIRGYPVIQTVHDFYPVCPSMTCLHHDSTVCATGLTPACLFQHAGQYPLAVYPAQLFAWWRMRRLLKQTVRHFITPSPLLQAYLEKNGFAPVSTIPPFISPCTDTAFHMFSPASPPHKGADPVKTDSCLSGTGDTLTGSVIPAQAGIHFNETANGLFLQNLMMDSRLRGNDTSQVTKSMKQSAMAPATPRKITAHHFLYMGKLNKNKGADLLIREFALACQQNPNLILKIAGSGPLETSLKKFVADHALKKNIIFCGWIEESQKITELYEETDAVLFSSIGLESFGLVITDSMRHARAVIGPRRGTAATLIEHQKTGLLFDPLIAGDLAKQILHLAAHPHLAVEYGKNARAKLAEFASPAQCLEKIMTIYTHFTAPDPAQKTPHPAMPQSQNLAAAQEAAPHNRD